MTITHIPVTFCSTHQIQKLYNTTNDISMTCWETDTVIFGAFHFSGHRFCYLLCISPVIEVILVESGHLFRGHFNEIIFANSYLPTETGHDSRWQSCSWQTTCMILLYIMTMTIKLARRVTTTTRQPSPHYIVRSTPTAPIHLTIPRPSIKLRRSR